MVGLTHLGPSNHLYVDQHRKGARVVMRPRLRSAGEPHSLDATPDQPLKGFDVQSQHRRSRLRAAARLGFYLLFSYP